MNKEHILILGGRSDIGKAVAHAYAKRGYNIYLAARNAAGLNTDVEDLRIRVFKSNLILTEPRHSGSQERRIAATY